MVRCLSVRQPWAGLVVLGEKRIECRSWPTRYRGRILIHAGLRPAETSAALVDAVPDHSEPILQVRGAIIGYVDLIGCRPATPEDGAAALCRVPEGWFAWLLNRPVHLQEPFPCRGRLGLPTVNPLLLAACGIPIREQGRW